MTIVHTILRATHAKGTHHYLALDALKHMQGADAEAWERVFLKHIAVYVEGSKAPDDTFKDFANHVLHPRDGYWGGAPVKATEWYGDLVAALAKQDWQAAAYAAGVLSHYALDPLMPLHTAQSEAENNVHAAIEWSVNRSYADLAKMAEVEYGHLKISRPDGDNWLAVLICQGADKATLHYETLLTHYDLKRGVVEPREGLDYVASRAVADMIAHAVRMFAVVLEAAIVEAKVAPPEISLMGDVVASVAAWPRAKLLKRARDAAERAEIEAMYDELVKTGQVVQHLAPGEKEVRARYEAEVVAKREKIEASNVFPLQPRARKPRSAAPVVAAEHATAEVVDLRKQVPIEPPRPAPPRVAEPAVRIRKDLVEQLKKETQAAVDEAEANRIETVEAPAPAPTPEPAAAPSPAVAGEPVARPAAAVAEPAVAEPAREQPAAAVAALVATATPSPLRVVAGTQSNAADRRADRTYLKSDDPVVDAPSIGPKTAARLNEVGIDTVEDFLRAHPIALAARLEMAHITPEIVTAWQDQAKLVCAVPGLRGTHAQLLVGAGYATVDALTGGDEATLCADVLRYALTPSGQRILRDGPPPDIEKIKTWITAARAARAA